MLAHMFFSNLGLKPGVTGKEEVDISFEVAPPVKMPEFLSVNENSAGYLVAEPLGTKAIATGIGELQFLSAELWENHPCCVVTLQQDFIENHTEAVFELTDLMVKAGKFIEQQPGAAAQIAVDFLDPDKSLGLKVPLLKNVLTEPMGIKTGDLYPVTEDLEKIQRYMHDKMGVGNIIDIDSFVDLRFAKSACKDVNKKLRVSKLNNSLDAAQELLFRKDVSAEDLAAKAPLNLEGKYLMFELNNRSFGIDILKIREIIRMVTIRTIPESPSYVLGVIDLRGNIVPVIDPKHIFNIIRQTTSKKQVIIVLETETENGVFQLGIVVDSVSQVTNITASEIEDTPSFVKSNKTSYFLAIAKIEGQLRILVDISELLDQQKMKTLRHVA